jgi:hypothetical protein
LKDDRATHAWILSSGNIRDIENPLLHILGAGTVHGAPQYLSSSRGELQGMPALSIVMRLFMEFYSIKPKPTFICDNSGVIKITSHGRFSSLRSQRDANMDLYPTQWQIQHSVQISMEWVKGHSEKKDWKSIQDLEDQQLTIDQIYNVWCDHMAETQWKTGSSSFHDPEVTSAER